MSDDKKLFSTINFGHDDSIKSTYEIIEEAINKQNCRKITANSDAKIADIVRKLMERELNSSEVSAVFLEMREFYILDEFRHSYSNISSTIYLVIREKNSEGCLDYLSTNISELQKRAKGSLSKDSDKKTLEKFTKFYDHIKLEVVRLKDHEKMLKDALSKIDETKDHYEQGLKEQAEKNDRMFLDYEKRIKKTKRKMDDIYSQFVSILGIFSAVVIVFFGGASIFTKILENIDDINWIKSAPVLAVTGFMMFNTVFMFLFIISRMIDRDIGVKVDENARHSKFKIFLWIRRYPYMFFFNIIMVIIFAIGICAG